MTPVDPGQRQSASAGCGPPHSSKLAKEVKKTTIGELNNAYGDTNASFDYSRGASSEIGVATSTSAGGPYVSAGFTHNVSNTDSAGVGLNRSERYGKKLLSQFEYGKYVSAYCGSARYYWRADEWQGGLDQEGQGDTLDKCEKRPPAAEQMPGSRFVRDRNKAEIVLERRPGRRPVSHGPERFLRAPSQRDSRSASSASVTGSAETGTTRPHRRADLHWAQGNEDCTGNQEHGHHSGGCALAR